MLTNNLINWTAGALTVIFAGPAAAQQVPEALRVPAEERMVLQVHAKGDQIYSCKVDGPQPGWTLRAPDAQLFDKDGRPLGNISLVLHGKRATAAE